MPEPLQTDQENPWLEFFRRVRKLAAQLDAQSADVEENRE